MNDIDAAIGLEQMKYINKILAGHRRNGRYYDKELSKVKGVKVLKREKNTKPGYWIYTLLVDKREKFVEFLAERGITTSKVHERNDTYTCFKKYKTHLHGVDIFTRDYISIPCGWWVSPRDAQYIVKSIKEFYSR